MSQHTSKAVRHAHAFARALSVDPTLTDDQRDAATVILEGLQAIICEMTYTPRTSFADRAARLAELVEARILTRDEAREQLGLPRREWFV